jgi:hypothetical protein
MLWALVGYRLIGAVLGYGVQLRTRRCRVRFPVMALPCTPSIHKPLDQMVSSLGGGGTSAILLCADTTPYIVPSNTQFSVLEDTLEDATTGHATDYVEREASSCFAAAAYVQRINRIA